MAERAESVDDFEAAFNESDLSDESFESVQEEGVFSHRPRSPECEYLALFLYQTDEYWHHYMYSYLARYVC